MDRELGSTLTTTNRFLRFLSTMAVAESTRSSSFDPGRLRNGQDVDLFDTSDAALADDNPRSFGCGSAPCSVQPLVQDLTSGPKVWWILDEASSLGHLPCLDDAVERLRGFGTRLFFLYQSMGQLEQCFPDGRAQTFLSNMDHSIFFGVNDLQTANAVSERLGMSTVPVWSENGGRSRNRNHGEMGQSSWSASSNDGYSISETGRKLLTPDEVMNLGERQAIVFTPGVRPFIARLVRYYEREFRSVPGRRRGAAALSLTFRSLIVASVIVGIAAAGIAWIADEWRRTRQAAQSLPGTLPFNHRQEQTYPGTFPGNDGLIPLQKGYGNAAKDWRRPRGRDAPAWPEGASQRAESFEGVRRRQ